MSQGVEPSRRPEAGIRIRNPQDFYGGVAITGVALFAFWASYDLPGMQGFAFGPGTAIRLFGGLLLIFGIVITAMSFMIDGPRVGGYAIRGPILITAALFTFAATIRPIGLIAASFLTFMIAAAASRETRWIEATIMAVAMTVFCVLLFVYLLNLPFQLIPYF
jgi:putative tricarboxylic transport membrane protein